MMIDHAARHLITTALAACETGSLLWVSDLAPPDALCPARSLDIDTLLASPWQQRHDIAIAWLPQDLPLQRGLHLLSALRDLHARQLLAFVPVNAHWDAATLRALALQQQARFEAADGLREAWSYDIRTYKAVPDWLNPKFWANPDNWGKYRW